MPVALVFILPYIVNFTSHVSTFCIISEFDIKEQSLTSSYEFCFLLTARKRAICEFAVFEFLLTLRLIL